MRDIIQRELAKRKSVSDWILEEVHETKTESYFAGTRKESFRTVESHYCLVTIFNRHDGCIGDTTLRITSPQESLVSRAIDEGIFIAKGVSNPDFQLISRMQYPDIILVDDEIARDANCIHNRNHEKLQEISAYLPSQLELASAELHLIQTFSHLTSSSGINTEQEQTSVIYDTVIVSETEHGESEQLIVIKRRRYRDINIDEIIRNNIQYALDKTRRKIPQTACIPVIFPATFIKQLLSPVIMHASMDAELKRYSKFNPNERALPEPEGDALSVTADPLIPLGLNSIRFDQFGIPAQKTPILENNMFLNRWGTLDVASWLGIRPTGAFGNLVVNTGLMPLKEMSERDHPVLDVVAFSDLIPNTVTGDFFAEIRLAYWLEEDTKIPITGGAVSGNVFQMFRNATFSREKTVHENYYGPLAIRFEGIQVQGSN